jgi:replication factor C small subunit
MINCVVLNEEEVVFDKETLLQIINDTYPDIRRTINSLQRNSIDGKLQLDESAKLVSNYMEKILEELKSFKDAKSSFQNIRQIIADSRVRTFDDLYRFLYDNLETFVPDGKRAMAILQIAESQYRAAFAVDKEIETMALFVNLIKILA